MKKMKKNNKKKSNKMYLFLSILLTILLIAGIGVYLYLDNKNKDKKDENTVAYTELIKEVDSGNIEKIEMTVGSTSLKVKFKNQEEEKKAIVPNTQAFIELIQEKVENGNNIELIQKQQNIFIRIGKSIVSFLPTILLVVLFMLIWKMRFS